MKRTLIRLLIVAVPAGLLTLRADSQTYVTTHRRATTAPTAPLEEDASQFPPKLVVAVALKDRAWFPKLLTVRNCEVAPEPTTTENERPRGSTET